MRVLLFLFIVSFVTISCTNAPQKQHDDNPAVSHMKFMGVEIDGKERSFLKKISQATFADSIFDCLELEFDYVETESFVCSYHGKKQSYDYAWFEFFPYTDPYTENVVYLHGRSILNYNAFDIIRISLFESMGTPKFNKRTLTDEIYEQLDDYEALVYKDLSGDDFYIWQLSLGYVILLYSKDADIAPAIYVELYIVDKTNFNMYIDNQKDEIKSKNEVEKFKLFNV